MRQNAHIGSGISSGVGTGFFLQPKTKSLNSVMDNVHSSCQALSTSGMCNRINSQIKSGCERELLKFQVRKYSRACPISPFSLITGSICISMNPKGNFLCSPLPNKHSTGEKETSCAFAQMRFGFQAEVMWPIRLSCLKQCTQIALHPLSPFLIKQFCLPIHFSLSSYVSPTITPVLTGAARQRDTQSTMFFLLHSDRKSVV